MHGVDAELTMQVPYPKPEGLQGQEPLSMGRPAVANPVLSVVYRQIAYRLIIPFHTLFLSPQSHRHFK